MFFEIYRVQKENSLWNALKNIDSRLFSEISCDINYYLFLLVLTEWRPTASYPWPTSPANLISDLSYSFYLFVSSALLFAPFAKSVSLNKINHLNLNCILSRIHISHYTRKCSLSMLCRNTVFEHYIPEPSVFEIDWRKQPLSKQVGWFVFLI